MAEEQQKALLMDAEAMKRALNRMAHEMIEQLEPLQNVVLIGIRRRGEPLARRLAQRINAFEGVLPVYAGIDINGYRDDRMPADSCNEDSQPVLSTDIAGRTVVLVDDVIFTGRSARAALDAVLDHGRPARICLAVLVDRGHRELPIRPDFVGKNVPTSRLERVCVQVNEIDGADSVTLLG